MSVISYRTKLDRKFLEKAAVQKLKYRSVNAFIDHAVERTLQEELGADTPAKKIAQDIARVVSKHYPLKFRAANAKEEKEMLKDLEDLKTGKVKTVRVVRDTSAPLRFTKPTAREDKEIRHRFAEMKKGRSISMRPVKQ